MAPLVSSDYINGCRAPGAIRGRHTLWHVNLLNTPLLPIVARAADATREVTDVLGGSSPIEVRRLRRARADLPAWGESAVLHLPRGFESERFLDRWPWSEVFVLSGRLRIGEGWVAAGDYAWFPPGSGGGPIRTPDADGADVLAVLLEPPTDFGEVARNAGVLTRQGAFAEEWGYRDLADGSNRLPLRQDRSRGETTWLARWPAGWRGVPTAAPGLALEAFVLDGSLAAADVAAPFTSADYLFLPPAQQRDPWRAESESVLLLRTFWPDAV